MGLIGKETSSGRTGWLRSLLFIALVLLLVLNLCQGNRIAGNFEQLSQRLDQLEKRLEGTQRNGVDLGAAREAAAAPAPTATARAVDRRHDIERLRRDRSVNPLTDASSGPPVEIGRHGGTLRIPLRTDVDGFNPITSKSLASFGVLFQVFDPLFFVDPWNLQLLPRLAVGYDVSDDLLDWTVHLRPGVAWADGTPFTADDVIFTYDLMRRPDVVSYSSREYDYEVDGERVPITWTKVDDLTVRFHQPLPYPALPNKLAFRLIVPAHRLGAVAARGSFQQHWGVGTSDFSEHVGTGPFRIARYEIGTRLTLERNARYWGRDGAGQPLPYLDRLVFEVLEGADVAWLRFKAGGLDLLGDITSDLVPAVRDLEREGKARLFDIGTDIGWVYLVLNQNTGTSPATGQPCVAPHKLAWFRERRFRHAVSRAIDRAAIAATVYQGLAEPCGSVYNAACGVFHDQSLDDPRAEEKHTPRTPAELLDQLGLIDRDGDGIREDAEGRPVEFALTYYERTPDLTPVASMVADQLRAVGIRARLHRVDSQRFSSAIFERCDFEVALGEDSSGIGLPCGDHPLFSSPTEYHLWFPRQRQPATPWEAEIDGIFRRASLERDPERVIALMHDFERIMAREEPMLFLVSKVRSMACRPNVANFRPAPLEPAVYWAANVTFLR